MHTAHVYIYEEKISVLSFPRRMLLIVIQSKILNAILRYYFI